MPAPFKGSVKTAATAFAVIISFQLFAGRASSEKPATPGSPEASSEIKSPSADSLPRYRMEEMVVTAKREVIPIENTPLSVSVLNKFDVETSLSNSSTGIAGELPGVFIQRTGDFGRHDVNIRGLGSRGRKSLVLIDGKPETMALFGCTVTHSFLMHDIQRVEVVRGPSSTMYGSGAMGGVLNIIPERPTSPVGIKLTSGAGSDGTLVTSGRIGASSGVLFGSASIDYRESDGFTENSAYTGSDAVIRAGACPGESSELVFTGKLFSGFREEPLPAGVSGPVPGGNWNDYNRGSLDLHFKNETDRFWYSARYYRNFGEHKFSDGWHSTDATDGILLHISGRPRAWLEISGGADWRYQRGDLKDIPDSSWDKWDSGIYGGLEVKPSAALKLSGGARYNYDQISGAVVSPSFGLTANMGKKTVLRAVAAHGFRSPQLNELYMFPSSNRDLEPERVWNYEAGLRRELPWNLSTDISAFIMVGENLIETVPAQSPPPLYIFQNTGEFEFRGLEASLEGKWRHGLAARISASLLDTGKNTRGRPGQKLDLALSWTTSRSILKINGTGVTDYYAGNNRSNPIDSYGVFNIYADIEIHAGLRAYAGLNNILDEEYLIFTDLPGGASGLYRMRGRNFMAGLKYSLK